MIYSKSVYSISEFLQYNGYELKKVFCDVYSISTTKIVELAAAVGCSNSDVTNDLTLEDICFSIEDNIDKIKERLVIHSQSIPYPTNNRIVYQNAITIWNECGECINLRHNFHPKLMLACFVNKDNKWFYRLQISTGNMTDSGNVDVSVIVEGEASENGDYMQKNGSVLEEFYKYIFSNLNSDQPENKNSLPEELNNLKNTSFSTEQIESQISEKNKRVTISNISFAYSFPGDKETKNRIKDKIPDEIKANKVEEVDVYSPFIEFDNNGNTYLESILPDKSIYYTNLTEEICNIWNLVKEKVRYSIGDDPFFHAKIYLWKLDGDDSENAGFRVWLGSANASKNGWENNVELCVGFTIKILIPDANNYYSERSMWGFKEDICKDLVRDETVIFYKEPPCGKKVHTAKEELLLLHLLQNRIKISAQKKDNEDIVILNFELEPSLYEKKCTVEYLDFYGDAIFQMDVTKEKKSDKKEINMSKYPFKGYMVCRANIDGKIIYFTKKCEEDEIVKNDTRNAESMLLLLNPFSAIQCIPRCAEELFSNPDDDMYERLSAFVCSYNGKMEKCFEMIKKRICRLKKEIKENENLYFVSEDEEKQMERLEKICE